MKDVDIFGVLGLFLPVLWPRGERDAGRHALLPLPGFSLTIAYGFNAQKLAKSYF